MTLDYQEDFDFFKAIFDELYNSSRIFTLREIVELLNHRPDIVALNAGAQEMYEKNLLKHIHVNLKRN